MNNISPAEFLRRAAHRASHNPFFLARDMEEFRARRKMQESDLARFLNCKPELLPKLGLCRRPDPDSPTFQSDITKIEQALGIQADRLIQIIRETDALDVFDRGSPESKESIGRGLLMAARDREREETMGSESAREVNNNVDETI